MKKVKIEVNKENESKNKAKKVEYSGNVLDVKPVKFHRKPHHLKKGIVIECVDDQENPKDDEPKVIKFLEEKIHPEYRKNWKNIINEDIKGKRFKFIIFKKGCYVYKYEIVKSNKK